jgi:hypothetical protein
MGAKCTRIYFPIVVGPSPLLFTQCDSFKHLEPKDALSVGESESANPSRNNSDELKRIKPLIDLKVLPDAASPPLCPSRHQLLSINAELNQKKCWYVPT